VFGFFFSSSLCKVLSCRGFVFGNCPSEASWLSFPFCLTTLGARPQKHWGFGHMLLAASFSIVMNCRPVFGWGLRRPPSLRSLSVVRQMPLSVGMMQITSTVTFPSSNLDLTPRAWLGKSIYCLEGRNRRHYFQESGGLLPPLLPSSTAACGRCSCACFDTPWVCEARVL
jgi:hypothetical protein